jgi:hypothetical protein
MATLDSSVQRQPKKVIVHAMLLHVCPQNSIIPYSG